MRPAFVLGEVWTGLRRNTSMAVSVVLVTMVSLVFLGVGLLADRQVEAAKGYWYDRVEVSIFLCTVDSSEPACADGAVTRAQRHAVQALLRSSAATVASYEFESQDEAYARFQDQFAGNPTFADTPKAAIPAAFRVKLIDPQDYRLIAQAVAGMPGVAAVTDIRQVLEPLVDALDLLMRAAWALAALMLVATVLLVATTVRQVAWSRRRETAIKRVVGASKAAIALPFLLETLVATTAGAARAGAGLWATTRYGVAALADRFRSFAWIGPEDVWAISPLLFAVCGLLTVAASWASLRRHVRR